MGLNFNLKTRRNEMALEKTVRSKIVRQELDLIMAGPHFGMYSAKVKYLPANIEKPDFFNLCYSTLKKGDEISVLTMRKTKDIKECFEVYYKFLVVGVDTEAKKVDVLMIKKVDLLNPDEAVDVEGVDPAVLNSAIIKIVDAKVKPLADEFMALKETYEKYTSETDDQLEEIENNIEALQMAATEETAEAINEE